MRRLNRMLRGLHSPLHPIFWRPVDAEIITPAQSLPPAVPRDTLFFLYCIVSYSIVPGIVLYGVELYWKDTSRCVLFTCARPVYTVSFSRRCLRCLQPPACSTPPTLQRPFVVCCLRSVVCLSSVFHHLGGTKWEAAATGTLGRWAYPESKLAMILFAKVRSNQSWAGLRSPRMT